MTQVEMDYLIQGISNAVNGSSRGGGGVSYRPRAGYISNEELNKFSKVTKFLEEVVGQVGAIYNEVKSLTDPWAHLSMSRLLVWQERGWRNYEKIPLEI